MAKKSKIEKNKRQAELVARYAEIRKQLRLKVITLLYLSYLEIRVPLELRIVIH